MTVVASDGFSVALAPCTEKGTVEAIAALEAVTRLFLVSRPANVIPNAMTAAQTLHCGISAPSADGFMAEMGHKPAYLSPAGPAACPQYP
jgi:hypothetical protein